MEITLDTFVKISGKAGNAARNDNMRSALEGLKLMGFAAGLQRPHRLAMFLAQTAQESGGWYYDREVWGPTAAQKTYEGRKNLGNTQPGDGSLFRGYTPMQITGRANTTKFYNWCRYNVDPNCPDFTKEPHKMNTDPWEGLGPIWYWTQGKPYSLNTQADRGDFVGVTKSINGGTNGLNERYRYYGRAAMVLLGFDPNNPKAYQLARKLKNDGIIGPATQQALHKDLSLLPDVTFGPKNIINQQVNILDSILKFLAKLFGAK